MPRLNTCPHCRAFYPISESDCPHCGTSVLHRRARERGGLFDRLLPGQFGVVHAIMIANIALYIGMLVFQGARELGGEEPGLGEVSGWAVIRFGGLVAPLVLEHGEWYRTVCPMFLHFNLIHIGFNCMVIWFLGSIAEHAYGPAKFLACYVAFGILALLASLSFGKGGVAAGASGAGFGLFGMVGVYAWRRGHEEIKRTVIQWGLISLVYGFVAPNIDNAAHLGGLAAGLAIGWNLRDAQWTRLRLARVRAWDAGAILAILIVLAAFGFAFVDGGQHLPG